MPSPSRLHLRRAKIGFSLRGDLVDAAAVRRDFLELAAELDVDIAYQEDNMFRRNRRLVAFDMDSTLIEAEVIDELAKRAGVGAEVAAITSAAMNGELDFKQSLRRRVALLEPHFARGARRVVVSAPVKDGPPNIVVGVNHDRYDLANEPIVTAASCTTNCLAPVVRVLHDAIGIERGLVTTIHDPTNTQSVHDAPHSDPQRARASQLSLIPTSTNSASC